MSKIYLPIEIKSTNCAYVYDKDTIRVYEIKPTYDTTINFTDYFINSNYLSRSGSTKFGSYNTLNYNCIDYTNFTTDYKYRSDFSSILIIAFILIFSVFYLVKVPVKMFFNRTRR